MDNDFRIDLAEVAKSIEGAEVVTLFFPILRKTLLIDIRFDVEDDPSEFTNVAPPGRRAMCV